jgi:hypothetical protein
MDGDEPIGTAYAPTCESNNLVITVAHNICDAGGNVVATNLRVVSKLEKQPPAPYIETFPKGFRTGALLEVVEFDVVEDWAVLKLKSTRSQFEITLETLLDSTQLPATEDEERFKMYYAPCEYFIKYNECKVLEILPSADVRPYGISFPHKSVDYPGGLSKGSSGGIALWKRTNRVVSIHLLSYNSIDVSETGSNLDDLVSAHNSAANSHDSFSSSRLLCLCPRLVKLISSS